MNPADAEEYTQALGQVVAGGWRQVALGERLGVPKALGLSTRAWVEARLGGYVRLTIEERREAAAELSAEDMSTREIGEVLGVSNATVSRDLTPDPEPVTSATADEPDDLTALAPTPEPVADVTADVAEPMHVPAELEPEPLDAEAAERIRRAQEARAQEAQRESERRAAITNLRSVLIYLTSEVLAPDELAADYADVLDEFKPSDLDYAAQTMVAIAARSNDRGKG